QGKRRRQKERLGPRPRGKSRLVAEGRADRRRSLGLAVGGGALGLGEKSRRDAQAERGAPGPRLAPSLQTGSPGRSIVLTLLTEFPSRRVARAVIHPHGGGGTRISDQAVQRRRRGRRSDR